MNQFLIVGLWAAAALLESGSSGCAARGSAAGTVSKVISGDNKLPLGPNQEITRIKMLLIM